MKLAKYILAMLVSVAIAACSGGSGGGGGTQTPAPTYSISGNVAGAAAVVVTLNGAANATATTDASGNYSFTGLANGSYTLTPSKAGFIFNPGSTVVAVNGANVPNQNFTAAANAAATFNISGTVTGAASVTVTLTGAGNATATTDAAGNYTFTGLLNGNYTVTPSKAGFTFAPANAAVAVNGANATAPNFAATAIPATTYSISGTVTGAASVTMTLTGAANATATTDAAGNYTFTGLVNGNYTVTPGKVGFTFMPGSTAVAVNGANVTAQNFTAAAIVAPTYSISGTVGGATAAGVTINLTGASNATVTTDALGNYTLSGLVNGSYTVTAVKAGFTFTPANIAVTVNGANMATQNFTATAVVAPTYSISGTVGGAAAAGVTMTLTGGANATATTDALGNYTFAGLANGAYTVAPTLAGFSFTPINRAVTVNGANMAAQNFTATANPAVLATVSGTITGPWIEGVTIAMSGGATGTAVTNATGNYSFANVASGGTYTFTPSLTGYTYTPATITIPVGATAATVPAIQAVPVMASNILSGSVAYAGVKTGRIAVKVADALNPGFVQWKTSIPAAGAYTIKGLNGSGNYVVTAEMDAAGTGEPNASNPVAAAVAASTAGGTNPTNINLTLTDPAAPAPVTPVINGVFPGAGMALVGITPPANAAGAEIATGYKIYWGTDAATATVGGGVKTVPAIGLNGAGMTGIPGLVNGSVMYFKATALVGGVESAPSPVSLPITIGAVAGGNTVSGTVTTTGVTIPAGATLMVGVYNVMTGVAYFTTVASPTAATAYTITGVPVGQYVNFAIMDLNGNGIIEGGEPTNTGSANMPMVNVVAGANTGNVTLSSAASTLNLSTGYTAQWNNWSYIIQSGDELKRVVGVTLFSGQGVPVPVDLAVANRQDGWLGGLAVAPTVGSTYSFKVSYSDGTSQILTRSVTGVMGANNVPTALATSTVAPASVSTPQFSWAAPAVPPAGAYTYNLWLTGTGGNTWGMGPMPSTQLSVMYNANGQASVPTVVPGTNTWNVTVRDANGNRAISANAPY